MADGQVMPPPASQDNISGTMARLTDLLAANRIPRPAPVLKSPEPIPDLPVVLGEMTQVLREVRDLLRNLVDMQKADGLWGRQTNETYLNTSVNDWQEIGPFAQPAQLLWIRVASADLSVQLSPDGSNWGNEFIVGAGEFREIAVFTERLRVRSQDAGLGADYQIVVWRPKLIIPLTVEAPIARPEIPQVQAMVETEEEESGEIDG